MTHTISHGAKTPEHADMDDGLAWLADRYLKTERDERLLNYLGEILQLHEATGPPPAALRDPLNGETHGLAVIGASGDGKSALIGRMFRSQPAFEQMQAGRDGNYLRIVMPPEGTIKSLAGDLLRETGYTRQVKTGKAHDLWATLRHRLALREVQLLWIDEAHHLLRGGAGRDPVQARQTLKSLMQGEGAVALLLSGVPQLDDELRLDPETDRRILRYHLGRFGERETELRRLRAFTEACCAHLGLDPPDDPHFAERIAFAGRGGLGRSIDLLKRMIRRAVMEGQAGLELSQARKVFELHHGALETGPFDEGDWRRIREILEGRGWQ